MSNRVRIESRQFDSSDYRGLPGLLRAAADAIESEKYFVVDISLHMSEFGIHLRIYHEVRGVVELSPHVSPPKCRVCDAATRVYDAAVGVLIEHERGEHEEVEPMTEAEVFHGSGER